MVEWLIEPLQYGFFIRGLIAGIVVAVACGLLSSFVVWRGMAFIGDALAHAVLPGIVIAVVLGIHMLAGALLAAFISVLGIGVLSRHKGFKEDTAIGVIFSGAFALGIIMMSKVASFKDLSHVLFGNILGVGDSDLLIITVIAIIVGAVILFMYKELLVTSFDSTHARAIGLSPGFIHFMLLLMIAATTVIASQTVGVVLVLALLVTPAATASLAAKQLPRIIGLSVVLSIVAVIVGFYASYYMDLASGGAIVLVLTIMFVIFFSIKKMVLRLKQST